MNPYIPEAAPILADMLDEVMQRLHTQEQRLAIPHRAERWQDCINAYCLTVKMKGLSLLADAPPDDAPLRRIDALRGDPDG